MYKYTAKVNAVLDANTVELSINLGLGVTITRILVIDGAQFPVFKTGKEPALTFKLAAQGLLLHKEVNIETKRLGRNGRYSVIIDDYIKNMPEM